MKYYLLLFTFFFATQSHAQKEDHLWLLGDDSNFVDSTFGGTILDFNTSPVNLSYEFRAMNFWLTNASICDSDGHLLFYTNGVWIANANHEEMENGDNIGPDPYNQSYDNGLSLEQGAIILPIPEQEKEYVLIHEERRFGGFGGLQTRVENCYYSTIDMAANSGLGRVVNKNNIIISDTLEFGKLTAVRHGNGRDWYVLAPDFFSDKYHRLLVDSAGLHRLSDQTAGQVVMPGTGQAVFSPDGSKYARLGRYRIDTLATLDIFDFDRCTGLLSNPYRIIIDTMNGFIYPTGGLAFSPNSRFLYFSDYKRIFQYDVDSPDILASEDTVAIYDGFVSPDPFPFVTQFRSAQLAPDGKIYINTPSTTRYLHVIHNPDEKGLACNVEQHAVALPTYNNKSLPNFPNYRLRALPNSPCDTLRPLAAFDQNPIELEVTFTDQSQRNPETWFWTFGDGASSSDQNPQHSYATSGLYEVCLTVSNDYGEDQTCEELIVIRTATNNLTVANAVKIFPNPATDALWIEPDWSETYTLQIYNDLGQLVLEKLEVQGSLKLDVGAYAGGVYSCVLLREEEFPVVKEVFLMR